jgi:DNA adenine methylase
MFIRYPGSKAKLYRKLLASFPENYTAPLWSRPDGTYCEPFFGSGAIGWQVLTNMRTDLSVIINDLDAGIAALWTAVRDCPRDLKRLVDAFRPSPHEFYRFKEEDGDSSRDLVRQGFQKLALHQMSFSGLGAMAGGPLGGRHQRSEYNTDCRWNPARIGSRIIRCHKIMARFARFDILCADFAPALADLPADAFAYLDPPYYAQGASLYKHAMTDGDHARLASLLRAAPFRWVLSYDDHPRVRELYSWAHLDSFEMTPTIPTARRPRRKNSEVVIRGGNW